MPDKYDECGNLILQELIAGELVPVPRAPVKCELVRSKVIESIFLYLSGHRELGLVCLVNAGFVIGEMYIFMPDVSIVALRRLHPLTDPCTIGAPEIAIEVISPTETETHLKTKIDAYRENGSKTVWVVYPDAQSVMVYSSNSIRELKSSDKLEDRLLPGFSVPVTTFFNLA